MLKIRFQNILYIRLTACLLKNKSYATTLIWIYKIRFIFERLPFSHHTKRWFTYKILMLKIKALAPCFCIVKKHNLIYENSHYFRLPETYCKKTLLSLRALTKSRRGNLLTMENEPIRLTEKTFSIKEITTTCLTASLVMTETCKMPFFEQTKVSAWNNLFKKFS